MKVLLIIIRAVLLIFSSLPVLFNILLHIAYRRVRSRYPPSVYDGEMYANPSEGLYFQAADYLFASCFYTIPIGIVLTIVLMYTLERRDSAVNRFFVGLYFCSILYLLISLSFLAGKALTFYFD